MRQRVLQAPRCAGAARRGVRDGAGCGPRSTRCRCCTGQASPAHCWRRNRCRSGAAVPPCAPGWACGDLRQAARTAHLRCAQRCGGSSGGPRRIRKSGQASTAGCEDQCSALSTRHPSVPTGRPPRCLQACISPASPEDGGATDGYAAIPSESRWKRRKMPVAPRVRRHWRRSAHDGADHAHWDLRAPAVGAACGALLRVRERAALPPQRRRRHARPRRARARGTCWAGVTALRSRAACRRPMIVLQSVGAPPRLTCWHAHGEPNHAGACLMVCRPSPEGMANCSHREHATSCLIRGFAPPGRSLLAPAPRMSAAHMISHQDPISRADRRTLGRSGRGPGGGHRQRWVRVCPGRSESVRIRGPYFRGAPARSLLGYNELKTVQHA